MFKLKIKHYRMLKRWTQKELGNKASLRQQYISDLEKENRLKSPTLHSIEQLGNAFGICPLELLICECTKCKKRRGE